MGSLPLMHAADTVIPTEGIEPVWPIDHCVIVSWDPPSG